MNKWLFGLLTGEYFKLYWTAAAPILASVAGSAVSGMLGSDANSTAGQQSGQATGQSNARLDSQATNNTQAYAPYRDTGLAANAKLADYLGLDVPTQTAYSNNYSNYRPPLSQADWQAQQQNQAPLSSGFNNNYVRNFGMDSIYANGRGALGSGQNYQQYLDSYNASNPIPTQSTQLVSSSHSSNFGSLLSPFSQTDLNNDTVYQNGLQFGLDQGTQAINHNASAAGGIDSGATLKALTRYANDYGTTKASGAYDRFMGNKSSIYNMLSGQQGVGLQSTNSNQNNNSNLMTGAASNTMANGSAQAGYTIGGASAINNAVQGGIGNYLYGNRINNGSVVGANTGYGGSGTGFGGGIQLSNSQMPSNWYQG